MLAGKLAKENSMIGIQSEQVTLGGAKLACIPAALKVAMANKNLSHYLYLDLRVL